MITGVAEAPGNNAENPEGGVPPVVEAVAIDRSAPEAQQQDSTDAPETAVSSEDRVCYLVVQGASSCGN